MNKFFSIKKFSRSILALLLIVSLCLIFAPSLKSYAAGNESVYELSEMGMDIKVNIVKNSSGDIVSVTGTATTEGLYINTSLINQAVKEIGKDFDLTITMNALTASSDTFTVNVYTSDLLSGKPLRVYDITNAKKETDYIILNKDYYTGAAGQTLRLNLENNRDYKLILATDALELDKKIVATVKPAVNLHYVAIGKTYEIKLSSGSNVGSIKSITYSSSDNYRAVIDAGGVVKGVTAGTADITGDVTFNNGDTTTIKTTIKVVATEKEAIELNKKRNDIDQKKKSYTVKVASKSGKTIKSASISAKRFTSFFDAAGKLTFKKISGNKKIIVAKSGKVTLKKGIGSSKGGKSYPIKLKIKASGNETYRASDGTFKINVKVKAK